MSQPTSSRQALEWATVQVLTRANANTGGEMPTINFQPTLREIRDVLKSDYYTIPRFQRPYSWTTENLDEFWNDVVRDNSEGYFIGPMVCYSVSKGLYGIVDGQQRMTTLTLSICALRDIFIELAENDLADGITQYIERKDDDSKAHYVLASEAAGHFFKTQFQARPPRLAQEPANDEQRALKRAFEDIKRWLSEEIRDHSMEPSGESASDAVTQLKKIRDRVLSLQTIWIQLDEEDDAYVIFETLNSRGKDLETVDLLKNLLLGSIRQENGDLDTARLRWNSMRETLSVQGGNANANTYLLHWWLSRGEYTAERKLFRLIKKRFDRREASEVLADLESKASTYARIANPEAWTCSKFEEPARQSLQALNLFNVRQPRPFLIALLSAYGSGQIKFRKVRSALAAIEKYHYITTAVVGVSSTGGISQMYASHARELSAATSGAAASIAIDGLVDKLRDRVSSRDSFVAGFRQNLYFREGLTAQKRLVQYTLRRLHDAAVTGVPTDHGKCNIEHIEPQSMSETWIAGIGNLLWVDENLNRLLGAAPFEKKKEILAKRSSILDVADILAADEWGPTEANSRAKRLAEFAYDTVWRF